jgi:hypothetical protein
VREHLDVGGIDRRGLHVDEELAVGGLGLGNVADGDVSDVTEPLDRARPHDAC